jgi:hypothetical protein
MISMIQRRTISRIATAVAVALVVLGASFVSQTAFAAKGAKAAAKAAVASATKYKGKVQAIAPGSITIKSKTTGVKTFTVASTVPVKVNHVKSTFDAIKTGMLASVWSSDGKTAIQIHAHDKGVKAAGAAKTDSDDAAI